MSSLRRCGACGASARTSYEHDDLPFGTTYTFRCDGCGREFDVLSRWRMIVWSGYVAFFVWLPTKVDRLSSRDRVVMITIVLGLALMFAYQLVRSMRNTRKNPRLDRATRSR